MRTCVLMFCASALLSQTPGPQRPAAFECHTYAVNIEFAEKLFKQYLTDRSLTRDQLQAKARGSELALGKFSARIGEEVITTKSFSIPGTALIATASVFFSDETMVGAESMWQALHIGPNAVDNAITATTAAITEVNFDTHTFKVLTKPRLLLRGTPWVIGLQCQSMSDEERTKAPRVPPAIR